MLKNEPSRRSMVVLVVGLLVALTSCGSGSDDGARGDQPDGPGDLPRNSESAVLGEWELRSGSRLEGDFPLVDGHPITITFLVDGSASGVAACNRFSGAYDLDGPVLRFRELSVTEMGCEPVVQEAESAFLDVLGQRLVVARDGDTLTLTAEGISVQFVAVVPIPTAELVGTTWNLHSLFSGNSASNASGEAMLLLNADGTFSATTGCRSITGTYRVVADQISVAESVSDGSCGPDEMRQDDHVLRVLKASRAEIEGDQLRLWNSEGDGLGY